MVPLFLLCDIILMLIVKETSDNGKEYSSNIVR